MATAELSRIPHEGGNLVAPFERLFDELPPSAARGPDYDYSHFSASLLGA